MPSLPRKIAVAILLLVSFASLMGFLRSGQPVGGKEASSSVAGVAQADIQVPLSTADEFYAPVLPAVTGAAPRIADPAEPSQPVDPITAEAYLAADLGTGRIYLEKNSSRVLPFASMSKLITAIAAIDRHDLAEVTEISAEDAAVPSGSSGLYAGERFTLGELLYPMLISSSNVAAEAVASAFGARADFLESMSAYAWEIGMPDTLFADPVGLSPRNAGTARDLFALARYLHDYRADILEITRLPSYTIIQTEEHGAHEVVSTHPFVSDPRFIGGKTGRTPEALETMLTMIEVRGRPVAIIVLRSSWARGMDTTLLIEKVAAILASER